MTIIRRSFLHSVGGTSLSRDHFHASHLCQASCILGNWPNLLDLQIFKIVLARTTSKLPELNTATTVQHKASYRMPLQQQWPENRGRNLRPLPFRYCLLGTLLCLGLVTPFGSAVVVVAAAAVAAAEDMGDFWDFASCNLNCINGGHCRMVTGTADELAQLAQGGLLIEQCVCLPGFGGTACDLPVEDCLQPDLKCTNGEICAPVPSKQSSPYQHDATYNADAMLQDFFAGLKDESLSSSSTSAPPAEGSTEWTCECAEADARSEFAGRMCRNPITEYCAGKYDPHAPLNFCTNGGRCNADFIAAQMAPGDTMENASHQGAGCRCPADFYGPHCEFLKRDQEDEEENVSGGDEESNSLRAPTSNSRASDRTSPGRTAVVILLSLMLGALAALVYFKRSYSSSAHEVNMSGTDAQSVSTLSTVHQPDPHYMDTISFSDFYEGIILPGGQSLEEGKV